MISTSRLFVASVLLLGVLASPAPRTRRDPGFIEGPGHNLPHALRLPVFLKAYVDAGLLTHQPGNALEEVLEEVHSKTLKEQTIPNIEKINRAPEELSSKPITRRSKGNFEDREVDALLDDDFLLDEELLDETLMGHSHLQHAPHPGQGSSEEPLCPACAKHILEDMDLEEEEEAWEELGHGHDHSHEHEHKDMTAAAASARVPGSEVVGAGNPTRVQESAGMDETEELSGGNSTSTNANATVTSTATATSKSTKTGAAKTSPAASSTSSSASATGTGTMTANSAGASSVAGTLGAVVAVMGMMMWL